MKHFLILGIIAVLAGGCKREKDTELTFISKFGGEPYVGNVKAAIEVPGESGRQEYGRASLQLLDSTSNIVRLILFGAIDNEDGQAGDVGFVLDGTATNTEWSFQKDPMQLKIDGNGSVSGAMETTDERYTYSGTISPTEFRIETVVERLTPTQGGYPAGTIFRFEHTGKREDPNAPPTGDGGDGGGGCKEVRWELRNVWNPGGGAMSLVRVPVCYD